MDLVQRAQVSASLDTIKSLSQFAQELTNNGVLGPTERKEQVDRALVAISNETMYLRVNILQTEKLGDSSEQDPSPSE